MRTIPATKFMTQGQIWEYRASPCMLGTCDDNNSRIAENGEILEKGWTNLSFLQNTWLVVCRSNIWLKRKSCTLIKEQFYTLWKISLLSLEKFFWSTLIRIHIQMQIYNPLCWILWTSCPTKAVASVEKYPWGPCIEGWVSVI